jgi:small subunit ribosomal protein S8
MMTDPIADFLTRIRNAILARHTEMVLPASNLKVHIAALLQEEGYIASYSVQDSFAGFSDLAIKLRWPDRRSNAITGLRRCSRPGQRVYVKQDQIPEVRSGLGIAILSTSRGLMTDRAARAARVGGELLCEVW